MKKVSEVIYRLILLSIIVGGITYLSTNTYHMEEDASLKENIEESQEEMPKSPMVNPSKESDIGDPVVLEVADRECVENPALNVINEAAEKSPGAPTTNEETAISVSQQSTCVEASTPGEEETEDSYYDGSEALQLLIDATVTSTNAWRHYTGDLESISVFAEDVLSDYMVATTAASYNLWGGNYQDIVFSIPHMTKKDISSIEMEVGMKTGSVGEAVVRIYYDDEQTLEVEIMLDAEKPPAKVQLTDIDEYTTMKIEIENRAGEINEIVFYNIVMRGGENVSG